MTDTLYFYDLETSGLNPRDSRIMQFAGQRTSLDLEPIGQPDNILIKMTNDVLPDPQAVLVTGITPQQTIGDGITERDFCKYFNDSIAIPKTTLLGFNSIRFDNEFIRFMLYRNFYDAYQWSYAHGNSIWDILDLARMTRALRPDGLEWPFTNEGEPTNSLESLAKANSVGHSKAHDALSDVNATIGVARLIKQQQPKLYSFLYNIRNKVAVQKIIQTGEPFVYTSGRYASEFQKTTVAVMLAGHPIYNTARALVYDLRFDPTEFIDISQDELLARTEYIPQADRATAPERLPIKEITFNKCPAVAPVSVLQKASLERIGIDLGQVKANLQKLQSDPTFKERIKVIFEKQHTDRQHAFVKDIMHVDAQLYDGFFNDADLKKMQTIRNAPTQQLSDLHPIFNDERLDPLLLLYKARQYPASLSEDEQQTWELFRYNKLLDGGKDATLNLYFTKIQELGNQARNSHEMQLLEELWLWGESIAPATD